jgi:hypothetical protein
VKKRSRVNLQLTEFEAGATMAALMAFYVGDNHIEGKASAAISRTMKKVSAALKLIEEGEAA